MNAPKSTSTGVTLIELAVTIALVGILGALIVNFVAPVRSYIDSSRRAALADGADTALRRIGRDLRLALPNSARVDGTNQYLEFLLVRTGGRYRYDTDSGATNTCTGGYTMDVLAFSVAGETCFKTIGNIPNIADVTTSDYVVVFNLQPGTDKADAYQNSCGTACNKSQISAATPLTGEDRIEFAGNKFTYESPGNRFFIIEGPVSYGCDGAGNLKRYWGYSVPATQNAPPSGGSSAILVSGVSTCAFTYEGNVSSGVGLATLALTLTMQNSQGGTESVSLYHAVHVNNVP